MIESMRHENRRDPGEERDKQRGQERNVGDGYTPEQSIMAYRYQNATMEHIALYPTTIDLKIQA